jgi:hypothetical protein
LTEAAPSGSVLRRHRIGWQIWFHNFRVQYLKDTQEQKREMTAVSVGAPTEDAASLRFYLSFLYLRRGA